jgi:FKBP-type peptidyl-prolyl cis-trans isomerase
MRYQYMSAILIILLYPLSACAGEAKLDTEKKKASYSFGVDFAKQLEKQKVNLNVDALIRGIRDVSAGKELAMQETEMTEVKTSFQENLRAQFMQAQKETGEKNLKDGKAFLEANAKKEGVITTESGLQYKIITPGKGAIPKLEDTVATHYKGTVIDGTEFDSSYTRKAPATFPVSGVIKGWTEALQLMKVGAKWQLFIPPELAYGPTARSEVIQANATLLFELELLEIKAPVKAEEPRKAK